MSQRASRIEIPHFWGVTTFFSNGRASVQLENLRLSSAGVRRQGLSLLIVELALGGDEFVVPDEWADVVLRVRADALMWHKERLFNLGIASLPTACRFVAWLDADVIFENEQWVAEARAQLEEYVVVQPYETCWLLGPGERSVPPHSPIDVAEEQQFNGFAATVMQARDRRRALIDFARHGHTGLAWAARRAFLQKHGLYDRAIVGGGDHIHAHAFAADDDFRRGRTFCSRAIARSERATVDTWSRSVSADTGGRIGWVGGRLLHLYHGPIAARGYDTRAEILKDEDFDPMCDIALTSDGCWRWNSDKPGLHRRVEEYFGARRSLSPA